MRRRNLVVRGPGDLGLVEEEVPAVPEGGLLLETITTGLSAGTELTFVKGTTPRCAANTTPSWDSSRQSTGSRPTRSPDSATWRWPAWRSPARLPSRSASSSVVGPRVGRLGDGVTGRRVVVTGAGLVGLFTALFALQHGAEEVAVIDADPRRLQIASSPGFLALSYAEDPALTLKTRWRHAPADHGADVAFQCRGRPHALATAMRAVRPQGTVVDLAFYTQSAADVWLGEEFHHNGLSVRCAQIGRTPRGTAGEWDRHRLSAETIRLLRSRGGDVRKHLVTDILPLEEAPRLLTELASHRRHVLSAVFTVGT